MGKKIDEETLSLLPSKLLIVLILSGCALTASRPKLEMSLAASAFFAARIAKAQVLTPSLYRKAEFYYLKAKGSYRRKYFDKAKQYAELSKNLVNKQNSRRLKKLLSINFFIIFFIDVVLMCNRGGDSSS